jgi:hypothetical protein
MEVDFTLSVGALPYHELLVDLAATEFTGHVSFARRTQTVFPPAACHQYRSRACPRFLVRLFHPLLHAGLARRTVIAIYQQLGSRTEPNCNLLTWSSRQLYAYGPWNLKVPNSTKHHPSTRLNYPIWRSIHSEGILFGLARDRSAIRAFPDNAIEDEN